MSDWLVFRVGFEPGPKSVWACCHNVPNGLSMYVDSWRQAYALAYIGAYGTAGAYSHAIYNWHTYRQFRYPQGV